MSPPRPSGGGTGLVVTHHPVLFRKVQRVTDEDVQGKLLLDLAAAKIAVLSPHARWDNAPGGINDLLCERFGLSDLRPLRVREDLPGDPPRGAGRIGHLTEPVPFAEFADLVRISLGLPGLDAVLTDRPVRRVAVACGSAGEYLSDAVAAGCDAFVTGEGPGSTPPWKPAGRGSGSSSRAITPANGSACGRWRTGWPPKSPACRCGTARWSGTRSSASVSARPPAIGPAKAAGRPPACSAARRRRRTRRTTGPGPPAST